MSNNRPKKAQISVSGKINFNDINQFLTSTDSVPQAKFRESFVKPIYPQPKIEPEVIIEEDYTSDYAKKYLEQEAIQSEPKQDGSATFQHLELLEKVSDFSEVLPQSIEEDDIRIKHNYFSRKHCYDESLPIFRKREEILNKIAIHQVVIIDGMTGCGKTTQVPQFIIDEAMQHGKRCNIIVTQPRKIAARSIAHRVSHERGWQLGGVVGYKVSLDSKQSVDTRILYVTTGVLLNMLLIEKKIDTYSHIILDEVHERDTEIDLAMLFIKRLLKTNPSCSTKILLMSATMQSSTFQEYFARKVQSQIMKASLVSIKGATNKVDDFYLNSLMNSSLVPSFDKSDPQVYKQCINQAYTLIVQFDDFEKTERALSRNPADKSPRGTVLIFLPGYHEIIMMSNALKEKQTQLKWHLLYLHSTVTFEEQNRVFCPPQPGYRKIILSTNICESSITVPDIKYVIDFCLTKVLMCDPQTNLSSLQTVWAPKSNCTQRKGRAGRLTNGRCYRLVSLEFYKNELDNYSTPEILNSPLDRTVLMVKKFDSGEPEGVLAFAIHPPVLNSIRRAVLDLKEIGALSILSKGRKARWDGDLTFIGRIIGHLPLDTCLGKLVIYGYVFGVIKEAIVIAACLSMRNIFLKPFQKHLEAYKSKLSWADGTFSDCLAFLFAYMFYQKHKRGETFHRPGGQTEETWCQRNYIEQKRIREVEELVRDINKRLRDFNIFPEESVPQQDSNQIQVLKVVICASFYPNYYSSNILDEREVLKELHSHDPSNTVILGNLPSYQGLLYSYSLEEFLKPCGKVMNMEFGNTKAMVTFDKRSHNNMDEKWIIQPIYLAIKKGKIEKFEIRTYEDNIGKQKMDKLLSWKNTNNKESMGSNQTRTNIVCHPSQMNQIKLPKLDQKTINLKVMSIISCSHFWSQYANDKTTDNYMSLVNGFIQMFLESNPEPLEEQQVVVGEMVIAPFNEEREINYYRAMVERVRHQNLEVFFIDYGNRDTVKLSQTYKAPKDVLEIPMLAFECQLSNIKPMTYKSKFEGQWTNEANIHFSRLIRSSRLIGHIYSVVDNVVRLELFSFHGDDSQQVSVNNSLIEAMLAEKAEESIPSKNDHEVRSTDDHITKQMERHSLDSLKHFNFLASDCKYFNEIVNANKHTRVRGPYSPLELSFCGITQNSAQRSIKINSDSLNTIVLNPEPQEKHSRMLVACHACLNREKTTVQLHATTLMPSIPGMLSLMAMTFAPYVELRMNKTSTEFTGALCGLGLEKDGSALHAGSDSEISFDTQIDSQDLAVINNIRGDLNVLLQDVKRNQTESSDSVKRYSKRLQDNLLRLLSRSREYRDPIIYERAHRWSPLVESLPETQTERNNPNVLPLIKITALQEDTWKVKMQQHLIELKNKASKTMRPIKERCDLCKEALPTSRHLLLHLESQVHLINVKLHKLEE